LNQKNENKEVKIRINISKDDPLFPLFNTIKKETGLMANTEVVRYSLKKAYDAVIINNKPNSPEKPDNPNTQEVPA
jgi:hypothetical protein